MLDKLKDYNQFYIIAAIGIAILLIVIYMFARNRKLKKAKADLEAVEYQYNNLKSIPLLFKLNKSIAIAKANENLKKTVKICEEDYKYASKNLVEIKNLLIESDDLLNARKIKDVNENIMNLNSMTEIAQTQYTKLQDALDEILEEEAEQRNKVMKMKKDYQEIKQDVSKNRNLLAFSENSLVEKLEKLEKKFTEFEEWMYLSEYEKSSALITSLESELAVITNAVQVLPGLITDAKGTIPNLIDEVKSDVNVSKQRMVYIEHLEVMKNLDIVEEALKNDLQHIQRCDLNDVGSNIFEIKERLLQIRNSIKRENDAYTDNKELSKKLQELFKEIRYNIDYVEGELKVLNQKIDSNLLKADLSEVENNLVEAKDYKKKLDKMIEANSSPNTTILHSYTELVDNIEIINDKVVTDRKLIENCNSDEKHAKLQLLKLQLLINEMNVKIRKNKLPQISNKYEEDTNKSRSYIHTIKKLLAEKPLNLSLLNSTVAEAQDFVYKLYNNVNSLVGMAIMVENTIVIGNKYRSSNPSVDSDLTRSELLFSNGEYTQALVTAITAIEKIFPENFENVLKESN